MNKPINIPNEPTSKSGAALKEIFVSGSVVGTFFLNKITQVFVNNSENNVELVYTFPIPEKASVSDFTAEVNGNQYTGQLVEKEKALTKYQDALLKGDSAYMLESHRDNIFQISVGNVTKGEEVTVCISYIQDIQVNDNAFRLVIPTLVSPRYIPGHSIGNKKGVGYAEPTSHVPDADFITPMQGVTNYKVNFNISIEADNMIREITSPSHDIISNLNNGSGTVNVNHTDANTDFILKVSMYGAFNEKSFLSQISDNKYFTYVSFMPKLESSKAHNNKEFIFMIDISGSMSGNNIESAKRALKMCLMNMEEGDTFNIIAFESSYNCFSNSSVEIDGFSFIKAGIWIDELTARGGTEIFSAVRHAVKNAKNTDSKETIIMLITDGQVGNESQVINYVKAHFNGRVFCVGIDVNVNDSFLNKISEVGNGFAEFYYPESNEDLSKKVVTQFIRSNATFLKNVTLDSKTEYEPTDELPNYLYNNECYNIIVKTSNPIDAISIIGTDNNRNKVKIDIPISGISDYGALLSKMWARKKIAEMEMSIYDINPRHKNLVKSKIISISKRYGIICQHTTFIAVNKRDDKQSNLPKVVVVPVGKPKELYNDIDTFPQRPMGTTPGTFTLPEFMSRSKQSGRPSSPTQPSKTLLVNTIIDETFLSVTRNKQKTSTQQIINAIINISREADKINFRLYFDKLDRILETLESLAKGDNKEFNDAFNILMQKLEQHCPANDDSVSISETASTQNFDGSFFHCRAIKVKYSLVTVKRLLNEGDIYIHRKQIKKALAFLSHAELTEQDEINRLECINLAEKVMEGGIK